MSEKWIQFNQLGKAGYNRSINRAQVNKIKKGFREDMIQPAIVSFRDGKYWIIDGQHRTQAIYELNNCDPNTMIRCDVRTGLTYEQEAELYYMLNTSSKRLLFSDELKGLIESKDAVALSFRDAVESCGYVVGGNASTSLRALKTAWKIFNKADGNKKLVDILKLTNEIWPATAAGSDGRIIEGIKLFLENHGGEYDRNRFVKSLSLLSPADIVRKSQTYYKQMDSKAFTQPYCTYSILVANYNAGLRNKLTPSNPLI